MANLKSMHGNHYLYTYTDDSSKYVFVSFAPVKSDVTETFIALNAYVFNKTNHHIETIRSDREEFKNSRTDKYCSDNGIQIQYSHPETPEQNGVSERLNRALFATTRALLN